jgi:ABC-type proline/glycine betaine transport system substrate-binding protein
MSRALPPASGRCPVLLDRGEQCRRWRVGPNLYCSQHVGQLARGWKLPLVPGAVSMPTVVSKAVAPTPTPAAALLDALDLSQAERRAFTAAAHQRNWTVQELGLRLVRRWLRARQEARSA